MMMMQLDDSSLVTRGETVALEAVQRFCTAEDVMAKYSLTGRSIFVLPSRQHMWSFIRKNPGLIESVFMKMGDWYISNKAQIGSVHPFFLNEVGYVYRCIGDYKTSLDMLFYGLHIAYQSLTRDDDIVSTMLLQAAEVTHERGPILYGRLEPAFLSVLSSLERAGKSGSEAHQRLVNAWANMDPKGLREGCAAVLAQRRVAPVRAVTPDFSSWAYFEELKSSMYYLQGTSGEVDDGGRCSEIDEAEDIDMYTSRGQDAIADS
ncbi:hypothetical protein TWF696_008004 [Orbilia brochopaga]|uniref:Uncharacterized protein n=1 Tax=Orbilia brochopaga TaxID=3140254 RepID=A0AAV9UQA1_9PEZI